MSTRATYVFKPSTASNGHGVPNVAFYIHYDGYPEGAADYMHSMVACKNDRGGLPGKFVRANNLAEFTGGHESHGDTEYRYTFVGDQLCAEKRPNDSERWSSFFSGHYVDFINQNSHAAKTNPIVAIPTGYGAIHHMTLDDAIAKIDHDRIAVIMRLQKEGWTGNNDSSYKAVISGATALFKACNDLGIRPDAVLVLGDDIEKLANGFVAVERERGVLETLSREALEVLAESRGLKPDDTLFGDPRIGLWRVLGASEYRANFQLETRTVTVKLDDDPRHRPQQYEVPVGKDALTWLNYGRISCLYTADQIIEEGGGW